MSAHGAAKAPANCTHYVAGAQRWSPNHQFEHCKRVRHVSCRGRLRVAHMVGPGRWNPPSNSNRHGRSISAKARVAAFRVEHSRRTPLARDTSHFASSRTRSRSVSGWSPLCEAIRVLPDLATHEVPAPVIQRFAPSSPPLAPPLIFPQLPVWPSTRLPWPPPVSLRGCRGVGAAWVCC